MTLALNRPARMPLALAGLILVQTACTLFFASDVLRDFGENGAGGMDTHLMVEAVAAVSLAAAVLVEARFLLRLLRRKAHLETSLSLANAAIHDVIEAHFEDWGLTPAEQDVATFMVKGLSTAEIARLRGNAEGTVKAHLHGIYRKSGTGSRAEVLSVLIESMMADPATAQRQPAKGRPAAG